MAHSAKRTVLAPTQLSALRSVVLYLRYTPGIQLGGSEFAEGVGITPQQFADFAFGRSSAVAPQIHLWLSEHLKENEYLVEEWAYSMFSTAFPGHPKFAKSASSHLYDVFLKQSDLYGGGAREYELSELLRIYSGVYTIFRYAAHLDIPEHPIEDLRADPYIVRAAMHIRPVAKVQPPNAT